MFWFLEPSLSKFPGITHFCVQNRMYMYQPCTSDFHTNKCIKNVVFPLLLVKEGERVIPLWCYQSEGLNKFNHLEVVVMLETRKKEDIFPEEVLRVYRGILHLATKLGMSKNKELCF